MAFRDLHEGVAALFAECEERGAAAEDWTHLRYDSRLARDLSHEAQYVLAARSAPGLERWRCPRCGDEVEQRPGLPRPLHLRPCPVVVGVPLPPPATPRAAARKAACDRNAAVRFQQAAEWRQAVAALRAKKRQFR